MRKTDIRISPRILFVDDEADIAVVIKRGLERFHYNVNIFTDPVVALEHFRNHVEDYDLVLSDIRMPGINGFQLARAIKELNPRVGIILITAFEIDKSEFCKVFPSTKVDGFVRKPVRPEVLKDIISRHISQNDIEA